MQCLRTYKFKTKAFGTITVYEHTFDDAWESFLRQGYAEADVLEVL